jgi:hypothetical protein
MLRTRSDKMCSDGLLKITPALDLAEEGHLDACSVSIIVVVGVWR